METRLYNLGRLQLARFSPPDVDDGANGGVKWLSQLSRVAGWRSQWEGFLQSLCQSGYFPSSSPDSTSILHPVGTPRFRPGVRS